MNRTVLKVIACVSMLLDHIGILLFPSVVWLRWCGRLAMPLFAFFIGEGCRYTSRRKRYAGSLLGLGAGCQAAYIAEALFSEKGLTVASDCWYFNILFPFFIAALICFSLLDAMQTACVPVRRRGIASFIVLILLVAAGAFVFPALRRRGWSLRLDYGIYAILLPVSAVLFQDVRAKRIAFSLALLTYCLGFMHTMPYVWFSLLCIPLLLLYNGKSGSSRLKYLFYIFYPAHLGVLYLISMLCAR
ncbi:MAG: hypothetical protein IJK02_04525 [Clostridia bacterium]|nr:hypothetical protein [Clostridia bacterium]